MKKTLSAGAVLIFVAGLSTAGFAQDGYDGLIAPSNTSPQGNGGSYYQQQQQPPGYSGLVPGSVPEPPAPRQKIVREPPPQADVKTVAPKKQSPLTAKQKQQMQATKPAAEKDPQQSFAKQDLPNSSSTAGAVNLETAAMIKGQTDKLSAQQLKGMKLPASLMKQLEVPHTKENGMWPQEKAVQSQINTMLSGISAKDLPAAERRKRADEVKTQLKQMQYTYEYRTGMPQDIYEKLGLPQTYVKEQYETAAGALKMVTEALKKVETQYP